MVRDEEIKRLRNYAKGLGCEVTIVHVDGKIKDYGSCDPENHKIVIYKNNKTSKKEIVLTLIHEIAHYKYFIKRSRKRSNRDNTLFENFNDRKNRYPPPWVRYYVYCMESNDTRYWTEIIRNCDIKLSSKIIENKKDLDLLYYELEFLLGEDHSKDIYNYFVKLIKRINKC